LGEDREPHHGVSTAARRVSMGAEYHGEGKGQGKTASSRRRKPHLCPVPLVPRGMHCPKRPCQATRRCLGLAASSRVVFFDLGVTGPVRKNTPAPPTDLCPTFPQTHSAPRPAPAAPGVIISDAFLTLTMTQSAHPACGPYRAEGGLRQVGVAYEPRCSVLALYEIRLLR